MNARLAHVQRSAAPLSGPELAIARSVLYASLFEYPLTLAQLRQTLIESSQTPTEILASYERSASLRSLVDYEDGYFFPAGRRDLLGERRVRERRSRAFLLRHRTLLTVIGALPFVRLVALSGSIAHLNLEGSGDLDLFIVTKGRHVWSVMVAVIILAKLLRRRQTLCANFVLADTALALTQQNLFTASQVIHLKPLVGGVPAKAGTQPESRLAREIRKGSRSVCQKISITERARGQSCEVRHAGLADEQTTTIRGVLSAAPTKVTGRPCPST